MNTQPVRKTLILPILFFLILSGAARAQTTRTRVDLMVRGGTVVTMDADRRIIENGAVAVSRGQIVAVGSLNDIDHRYTSTRSIDARGKVVIPGLINGHTHIPMTLFRGLADDLDLNDWLTGYIFPAEAKNVTEAFVRAGTRLGLAEMIRGGITLYCDMYYFEDAVADETARAGVRGLLGEAIIDFPAPDYKTNAEAMAYTEKFVKKWHGHPLITPAIAPHSIYTVSEEHLKSARALSDSTGAPLLIHLSETRKEVDDSTQQKGDDPIAYLARIHFLSDRLTAAHVVFATAHDIDLLKQAGVGVVHNPHSNMKLSSGVSPVPAMLAAGIKLGLGTDGAASNNVLNMWEEMDMAAKLHKVVSGDPRVVSAQEALELATIRGAQALHMDRQVGSIEKGKRADLVIVDMDGLHQTPRYNIYSSLVYSTKSTDVRTVVIEGRIVMLDRRLLTLDEEAIKRDANHFCDLVSKSLKP